MNVDLNKIYKKFISCSFCEQYNINKDELSKNDHMYFRYLCFSYLEFIRHIEIPNIKLGNNYETVFIEFRILPHIEFLIRNTIIKLGNDWSHTVICGNNNYEFIYELCNSISPQIKIIKMEFDNLLPNDYNIFLTSFEFWKLFQGEKILIYQEDSIMFKNNIREFLKYDYIGAPFPKSQNDTPNLVGNGGFSLRTKSTMIKVINMVSLRNTVFNSSTINYMNNSGLTNPPEDVYFSKNIQELKLGNVANYDVALKFSSESVINKNSLGGHKFWISNSQWKQKMKNVFGFINYIPNSNLSEYLKYYNVSENHSRLSSIPNAFDIDLYFCDVINNLFIGNNEDIMKYIKLIGLNGFIYHPKQLLNIFPNLLFYTFMNNIFIIHKFIIYKSSDFVNKFIYSSSYKDLKNNLIKNKYYNLDKNIDLLLLVFIGNEERGIDLIKRIVSYKNIENFNVSFCFNNTNKYTENIKGLIKGNFVNYAVYSCKELGTDITPTLLMCDDILKIHNFKHIIKLHTKGISNQYNDLTDYIMSVPINAIINEAKPDCNCIGNPNYYINLKSDNFNNELFIKYSNSINIKNSFVGGTIFYAPSKIYIEVINFIINNNYRSYFLNNLYENNCINKDYSPIHFIERLFGVIKL
jgi:hypothetical protein